MTEPDVLDTHRAGGLLLRGSVLRMAGFIAAVGLSVISATLLTRYLGVARFGQYTTVLSLVLVVAAVTDGGMSTYGTREYATRHGEDRRQFMATLLGLRVALTLGGATLTVAFALAAGYDVALVFGAVAASLANVPLVFQHTLSIPLSAHLRLGTLSALELGRQALLVAGLVALVIAKGGVLPLLTVSVVANALLIWPTAVFVRGQISLRPALNPRRWPPLLRSTAVFSLAAAVGTIYVFAAQILTSLVTDQHQSGLFAVSFRVFIVAGSVPGLLVGAALPLLSRAARDDTDRLAYALARIFQTALVCGVGAALGVSAGAGFVVSVIAGPKYASAAPVLAIQAWGMVGSFTVAGWSFALLALREHRNLLAINLMALAASLLLTLVLAGSDGAQGAAIATVGGETALALLNAVALGRRRPAYRPPWPVIGKVLIAATLTVPVAYLSPLSSFVRAALGLMLYCLLVLALRAVPEELLELLPSRRR
ncbi:MAG: polysaccharide biosynthesis C-terminal domain-containing protein [Actinomycetota bacterium]|nr:polysaccharide biosynthesis C-terminal domain-containing protein [Actinomycetota bacterium]